MAVATSVMRSYGTCWGADAGYRRRVAQKVSQDDKTPRAAQLWQTREAIRVVLATGAGGEIPREGLRGGALVDR